MSAAKKRVVAVGRLKGGVRKAPSWRMPRCPFCDAQRKQDPCEQCGESSICGTCGGFRFHSHGCEAATDFVAPHETEQYGVRGRT